ncbi:MAG: hypothetical protein QHJ73_10250, partial [Armatimonadota bacterium]|nr:hypothetical protein [Armatimonadota bacterium]
MGWRYWVAPLCLVLYHLLFTLWCNTHQMVWDGPAFAVTAVFSLAVAGGVYGLLWRLFRNPAKASLAACLVVFSIYSYGLVVDALAGRTWAGMAVGRQRFLLPVWGAASLLGLWAIQRSRRSLEHPLFVVRAVILFVLMRPVFGILWFEARAWGQAQRVPVVPALATGGEAGPDIYYLVLDRYASDATLREFFGFDNRPFLNALRARGFYVAEASNAN